MPADLRTSAFHATWLTPTYISRLEALQLSVKWVRSGTKLGGRFPINRRGSSVEFADYAAYYAGDDIRAIDWNLYARLERLFIKTYHEQIELSVEIIIDATGSMGLPAMATQQPSRATSRLPHLFNRLINRTKAVLIEYF